MIVDFVKISLTRKIVVCILIVLAIAVLFDGGSWIGAIITISIAYILIKPIEPQSVEYKPAGESEDEYYYRCQQDDADVCSNLKEEERISQENMMNQEALDRLL